MGTAAEAATRSEASRSSAGSEGSGTDAGRGGEGGAGRSSTAIASTSASVIHLRRAAARTAGNDSGMLPYNTRSPSASATKDALQLPQAT